MLLVLDYNSNAMEAKEKVDPADVNKSPNIIKVAKEEIGKLDVLVCGECHNVFHYIEEFQEHKENKKCKGVSEIRDSYKQEQKLQIWAFMIWKHAQLKKENETDNISSPWSIYQEWSKMTPQEREPWIVASESIQSFTKIKLARVQEFKQTVKNKIEKSVAKNNNDGVLEEGEINPANSESDSDDDSDEIVKNNVNKTNVHKNKQSVNTLKNIKSIPTSLRKALRTSKNENIEEGIVEKILGRRLNKKKQCTEYFIKWAKFSESENTWEPKIHLIKCRALMEEFDQLIDKKKNSALEAVKSVESQLEEMESDHGRPQRTSKQKALNQVKVWCGDISEGDESGKRKSFSDDDSTDSFEKRIRMEDDTDSSDEEKSSVTIRRVAKSSSLNGVSKKNSDLTLPTTPRMVRVNQKQLPNLSSGVYIMSKTDGIIKLDSNTTPTGPLLKVGSKIGQTHIKMVKKDECSTSKTISSKLQLAERRHSPVSSRGRGIGHRKLLSNINPTKTITKVEPIPIDKLSDSKSSTFDDDSDGLEELDFPTDLPLPEPDSPPGEFTLCPLTGRVLGEMEEPKEAEDTGTDSTSLDVLVKLAAATLPDVVDSNTTIKKEVESEDNTPSVNTEVTDVPPSLVEDPKEIESTPSTPASAPASAPISAPAITTITTTDTDLEASIKPTTIEKAVTEVLSLDVLTPSQAKLGDQTILNTTLTNVHVLNTTSTKPTITKKLLSTPSTVRQKVTTFQQRQAITRPTMSKPSPHTTIIHRVPPSRTKFGTSKSVQEPSLPIVKRSPNISTYKPTHATKRIGNTTIYKSEKTPQVTTLKKESATIVSKPATSSPKLVPLSSTVINMPLLTTDEEASTATTTPSATETSNDTQLTEVPSLTTLTTDNEITDLSSFNLSDSETPLLITGDDGTIYQVAGQNEEGQTILISEGLDGQQHCVIVSSECSSDELSVLMGETQSEPEQMEVDQQLTINTQMETEGDGAESEEAQIVAQIIKADTPSPDLNKSFIMVYPPLIPKSNESENLDVLHILQEVFQSYANTSECFENVVRNISQFNTEDDYLKKMGNDIIDVYNEAKLSMDDISHSERRLMISQGESLKLEHTIKDNVCLLESIKLTRKSVFKNDYLNKHPLIRKSDLLPTKAEIAMDFRLNLNEHRCKNPCESGSDIFKPLKVTENCVGISSLQKKSREVLLPNSTLEVLFVAEPNELNFIEYCIGVTYEKKIKLRNVSTTSRSFVLNYPSKIAPFKVKLKGGETKVAPGMFATLSVTFCTNVYHDEECKMTIYTYTGKEVMITFKSCRTPPRLLAFIFKNVEHFQEHCQFDSCKDIKHSDKRQVALNSSIDLGGCLLGSSVEIKMIIDTKVSQLSVGSFTICPVYFEVGKQELVELRFSFAPEEFGLEVEKLFLLCDNNTVKELEIIGDGLMFDNSSVSIDQRLHSKVKLGLSGFDDRSDYIIYFKNCLSHHKYFRTLTVHNNCSANFCYKWFMRDIFSKTREVELHKLNQTCIYIKNAPSYLHSNSESHFQFVLNCPDVECGVCSLVLVLYILDVPEKSIVEEADYLILNRLNNECETSTSQLNIQRTTKGAPVIVKVFKPQLKFLTHKIDFGFISKSEITPPKCFYIQNTGEDTIDWSIAECVYNFETQECLYLSGEEHLDIHVGRLCSGEVEKLTYSVESMNEECRWISFLILLLTYPIEVALDSVCTVTFEVRESNMKIHSPFPTFPIIFPRHLLYLGHPLIYQLCIHNCSEKMPRSFMFGTPKGSQVSNLQIHFAPKSGITAALSCVHVTMTLCPLKTGIVHDIRVPCIIEFDTNLIFLSILCAVDNIHLNYYLPNDDGKFRKVFWPPPLYADLNLGDLSKMKQEECQFLLVEEAEESVELTKVTSLSSSKLQVDLFNHFDLDFKLSLESSSKEEMLTQKSSSVLNVVAAPLRNDFDSDVVLQQHIVEFRSIPLRTAVVKQICLENPTPILGNFCCSNRNFSPICKEDTKEKLFQRILAEAKIIPKSDEWDELVNIEYGVLVKLTPSCGSLQLQDVVPINIWIYANTWGTYIEEVTVYVNNVEPLRFNILFEIVGIPIEFPISLNSIAKETVLRFGSLACLSEPKSRILKIRNYGCIPLHFVWHVFLVRGPPTTFNLIMESFDETTTNSNCNGDDPSMQLLITPKYYGQEVNFIFQVTPRSTKIQPKDTAELTIQIDPRYLPARLEKTELKAYLIGFQSNLYVRKTDIQIAPAQVKLLATIELPLLELQLLTGDMKFSLHAEDIIEAQEVRYNKTLIFFNKYNAIAEVSMHMEKPFNVIHLSTEKTKSKKCYRSAKIFPRDCLYVLIECTLDTEQILQYSDMLFNTKTTEFPEIADFSNNSVIIRRALYIFQLGVSKQVGTMECIIYYPIFQVSHDAISFGIVFSGNVKEKLLILYNKTGSSIPFKVNISHEASEFEIKPSEGVIPKGNGRIPASFTVNISFKPS
ncbi:hypothetical protein FQA39_LY01066 [Lamprigera yunnana]|nr:hypothetical protein FQA39_LY01066 [Lamprigera yunnana]